MKSEQIIEISIAYSISYFRPLMLICKNLIAIEFSILFMNE
jgi:hypothetical protein